MGPVIDRVEPFAAGESLGAAGAYERVIGTWRGALEEYVHNNLNGARASDLRDRIANMGNIGENVNRDKNPQDQSMWKDAINSVLTTEQNETWKKELDARIAAGPEAWLGLFTAPRSGGSVDSLRTQGRSR